jgi:pimeloyl-ACP methyl ester carboxylesterase
MRRRGTHVALALAIVACGHAAPAPVHDDTEDSRPSGNDMFVDRRFTPKTFVVHVTGHGRPVIFIPGLGCPGEMWTDTVDKLPDVEAHVVTLAGFAGVPATKPPLAANARRELVRYIRSHHLDHPVLVGHSLGGFLAYWLAETAPDLIGGVVVVDSGAAIVDNDPDTAHVLRNMWAQAGDDELPQQVRDAYSGMVGDPQRIAPYIDAIARSDRQTMGDAIYEIVKTDLRTDLGKISAPLLLVLSDGGYQQLYRSQADAVHDREVVVMSKTHHFVMLDDPDGFVRVLDKFLAAHPAK